MDMDTYIISILQTLTQLQEQHAKESDRRFADRLKVRQIETRLESTPDERFRTRDKSPHLRRG